MERKYWWYSVATSSSSNLDSDKCNKTSIKPGASPGRSLNNRHVTNLVCSIGSDPVRPGLTKHQATVGFIMFDVLLSYLILSPQSREISFASLHSTKYASIQLSHWSFKLTHIWNNFLHLRIHFSLVIDI